MPLIIANPVGVGGYFCTFLKAVLSVAQFYEKNSEAVVQHVNGLVVISHLFARHRHKLIMNSRVQTGVRLRLVLLQGLIKSLLVLGVGAAGIWQ